MDRILPRRRPIGVAIHVADRALRERMTRALVEAGNFASARLGDADVTIADGPEGLAGPVIALVPTVVVPLPADLVNVPALAKAMPIPSPLSALPKESR